MKTLEFTLTENEVYVIRDALIEEYQRLRERLGERPTTLRGDTLPPSNDRLKLLDSLKERFTETARVM